LVPVAVESRACRLRLPHHVTASDHTDHFCPYEVGDATPLLQTVYASVSAISQLILRLDHLTDLVTLAETVRISLVL